MTRELSYAPLDADGQVPLDRLDNAPGGSGAPDTVDYLVGTADAGLSNEIVVGTTPGGELGNTWASPTVDATHSGSTHAAAQAAAEATAAGALGTHAADTTAIHGIADTSALSLTSHDHDADYEAAGGIATHSADSTAVHGIVDTSALSLTSHDHDADYEAAGGIATHAGAADPHTGYVLESDHTSAAHDTLGLTTDALLATAVSDHAALADPHTGYRLESADHSHATTGLQGGTVAHSATTGQTANDHHAQAHTHPAEGAVVVTHASTTGQTANDHHAQAHAADHLPTGTDAVNKFSQAGIGTADLAIANTETVIVAKTFAAAELTAGMTFMFKAYATRAGTTSASPIIRIRIGTTTLTGNIAATLTPPVNTLAVGNSIEGMVTIRSAGAGGTALGSLMHTVHLAAVTITESLGVSTATVAVDTTAANQKVELTFISGNAANTYTWRGAVIYRVA